MIVVNATAGPIDRLVENDVRGELKGILLGCQVQRLTLINRLDECLLDGSHRGPASIFALHGIEITKVGTLMLVTEFEGVVYISACRFAYIS